MVDCAKGSCVAWHSRSALASLQPQPRRLSFEQRDTTFAPLVPGQQLGHLSRRRLRGRVDRSGRGDARSSSFRKISMCKRIAASQSLYRARRASEVSLGLAAGAVGGGWSGNRLTSCSMVAPAANAISRVWMEVLLVNTRKAAHRR